MCVLLHLLICTALRAHIIVVEALYKINYYYYYYYYYLLTGRGHVHSEIIILFHLTCNTWVCAFVRACVRARARACVCVCVCDIYIYIYIERERERERESYCLIGDNGKLQYLRFC